MYAINRIFTEMGLEPLSYIEELQDGQGIDLIKLRQERHMHAYYMTLLFYPKSLIYRQDIEYLEGIFELCGSLVLDSYITLLKYYSFNIPIAKNYTIRYNIGIALDLFCNTEDITAITTVEKNTTIKIRVIKLPLSTLGDKTILNYGVSPQNLLIDILGKGKIRFVVSRQDRNALVPSERLYVIYVIDLDELNLYFHYPDGYVIGTASISEDIACIFIQKNICVVYINDNIMYSVYTVLDNLLATDLEFVYKLYQVLNSNTQQCTLTDFLDSLRGYVKMFIDQDICDTITDMVKSDSEIGNIISNVTDRNNNVVLDKLYGYLDEHPIR